MGYKIDFVPGKRQSQYGSDHSLYKRKADTWTQTNIDKHITIVIKSKRIKEIKLCKIWRQLHTLDFPSFYLELATIDCLKSKKYDDLANNFFAVLEFLAGDFKNKRYIDPANTNNIISDDLTMSEKQTIKTTAGKMLLKKNWDEIIW